jgi:hypothetical protein
VTGETLFSQREVQNAVPKSDSITTVYRFGPFEVNTTSGELLKHGVRVKLQEQPFRLLIVLLEHAGEPVTHEDLHRRIWENNTFVEFDSSLRVAARKLRDALATTPTTLTTSRPFLAKAIGFWVLPESAIHSRHCLDDRGESHHGCRNLRHRRTLAVGRMN